MTLEKFTLLTLKIKTDNPEMLREGLEVWIKLGLIDDSQVKQICQVYLSCKIPERVTTFAPEIELSPPSVITQVSQDFVFTPFAKVKQIFSHFWTAFREELSVRWLLFLGLFLVIVSSGVLAATQWKNFPNIGQYLVLLTYTLVFLGVSIWANRNQNLQLTAKTLEIIALLLIPINFWAIDAFNLWNHPLNSGLGIIASLLLSFLYYNYRKTKQSLWVIANFLGLSYLHWGWDVKNLPLLLIYSGLIATVIISHGFSSPENSSPYSPLSTRHRQGVCGIWVIRVTHPRHFHGPSSPILSRRCYRFIGMVATVS